MSYSDRDRVYAWLDAGHGEKLTTLDRCILVTIAERANDKSGLAAPGVGELARRWGIHPESAGRSVARLHRLGLLDTVSRGYGQHRARYMLAGELAKFGKVAQPTGGLLAQPKTRLAQPKTRVAQPTGWAFYRSPHVVLAK
jgi:DNA-binding IclR family transcriptional regulator